jgi:hypothetical protein
LRSRGVLGIGQAMWEILGIADGGQLQRDALAGPA